ncbi:MAG TPA: hypothetical protein VKG85_07230 [Actinomycetes bacterium]|nr:hypothetical protein [Actinomycetes bacterium]
MHNDLDSGLSRVAERAGGTARLRSVAQIRARGDRRRIQHRVGTVALSVGVVGLTAVGVAAVLGNGGPGGADRSPVATSPPTTAAPSINEEALLSAADVNRIGPGWRQTSTNRTDYGSFVRCQRDTLASVGATEVLVRTFGRSGLDDVPLEASQLIAYFPTNAAATDAYGTVFQWLENCDQYATGTGGEPAWVGGDLVNDTVQPRGAERPATGAAWQYRFDDNIADQDAWFDSIGVGAVGQYLTIVTYGDYGQDANYEPDQMPGVVLLQDAFAKLPS